ncbi:MAG TPA: NAD(+) synthase, partial [Clostridiaceae bacterium]|nr:NAD(+) synthase [Clostridiaceae bacterium]
VRLQHTDTDERWFDDFPSDASTRTISYQNKDIPFGHVLLEHTDENGSYCIGICIGDDIDAPAPLADTLALAGAELIVHPAAGTAHVGRYQQRRNSLIERCGRLRCAYLYAGAGTGESTTARVYDGHRLICESGDILAENLALHEKPGVPNLCDVRPVDVERLKALRRGSPHFRNPLSLSFDKVVLTKRKQTGQDYVYHPFVSHVSSLLDERTVDPHPFIPHDPVQRDNYCRDVLNLQAQALAKRLRHVGAKCSVIGVSGGLDSTLALLATAAAYEVNGWPSTDILGITMPGFGTTELTHTNAHSLMEALNITIREIPIGAAVSQHFSDIGHDPDLHDVVYENSQARERTQILMDVANQVNGLVIGTGDLSELALGWCTYNGDQMSMYALNGGVPKTLIRHIIAYAANSYRNRSEAAVNDLTIAACLESILATPISPELLPPDQDGNIAQHTEDTTGPYELHDFFLYHTVVHRFDPAKLYTLARRAFADDDRYETATPYTAEEIMKWLRTFYRRFFTQQFKRSALPDGPQIMDFDLSPKNGWAMPSDADVTNWLAQLDDIMI